MSKLWKVLTRKKVIDPATAENSSLSRILNTFDLTALGVGSTLGVGVYVLAGHVAKETAGPSVVLSFLIAAIASVFAGLCYAEFGARTPRAGSAYIYSYVCVGEFIAFVIGWNLILEYVIGSASVARGITVYLDMLINNTLQDTFIEVAPINIPYLSKYFDFLSFGLSLLLAVAMAFGLKESSLANNIFTSVNVLVVLFVIVFGAIKADPANWHIQPNNSSNSTVIGKGGFFPFGVEGMIKGAATCFYGFVGFDCIATTGEEVKNPKKAIPTSIILSLFIVFLAYFGTSTVVTLMVPYYLQNPDAPIPFAFEHIGWEWAKWIVSIGGIFGLCASLFGAMFPLPRIIYAMANDSLVFKSLGRVSPRFQTPVIGTLLAGLLTGLMAAIFDLKQLVNMMSIGTLLAYTIVAACVLLLRYSNEEVRMYMPVQTVSDSDDSDTYTDNRAGFPYDAGQSSDEHELLSNESHGCCNIIMQIFNCGRNDNPTKISESIVAVEVFLYCLLCLLICLCAKFWKENIMNGEIWAITLTSITVLFAVLLIMSMVTQPTSKKQLSFKVPWVPLIPALSILINIYLMLMLDVNTWIRFGVWMALGIAIYYYSHRPFEDTQFKKNLNNDTEKRNGISFINNGFDGDTLTLNEASRKKKRAPPPPRKSEDKITEIQQELQKLDRMLDDVLDESMLKRSLSLDNVSDIPPRRESVIADVHRENVAPLAESPLVLSPLALQPTTTVSSDTPPIMSPETPSIPQSPPPTESSDTPLSILLDTPLSISLDTPPNLSTDSPSPVPSDTPLSILLDTPLSISLDTPPNLSTDTPSPVPSDTPSTLQTSFEDSDDDKTDPPSPLARIGNGGVIPPPPPMLPPQEFAQVGDADGEKRVGGRPRIQASALRKANLKSVEVSREQEKPVQFVPDDDNLRVGSNEYKSFKENLEGKLSRILFNPSYVRYEKRPVVPDATPVERKKNENVIEDSIDKDEARAKLGLFVNSRLNTSDDLEKDRKENTNNADVASEDAVMKAESPVVETEDIEQYAAEENLSNEDFLAHKGRMNNIFRSINLKNPESMTNPGVSREFKSLGHKIDDKHRQAMDEVFKTIELRRKE